MVHDLSGVSTPRLKNIDARDFRKMDATKIFHRQQQAMKEQRNKESTW